MKRIRDLRLAFTRADGSPRMWTVIIGENGTGKTSLLHAIAMAAAGSDLVNGLASRVITQLRDRRSEEAMQIEARFGFQDVPGRGRRVYPHHQGSTAPAGIVSTMSITGREARVRAQARYLDADADAPGEDPLAQVRSENLPHWFVAGYGVARAIPDAGTRPRLDQVAADRLASLFDSQVGLTSTAFANYFPRDKSRAFARVLRDTLLRVDDLVPHIVGFELRGQGGVGRAGALQESERFTQQIGDTTLRLPLTALAHGYQSTVAWIADLVGHILLEADGAVEAEHMQGLVLIDELDLYLHPVWQVVLVSALRQTFPQLQFVTTTHSPLITSSLAPDEIVALGFDRATGDVIRVPHDQDPRVLTGTEIYRAYFGLDEIYPDPLGRELRDYRALAANPFRSDVDDARMAKLLAGLTRRGVEPRVTPVERQRARR
ncbi:MAG: AAA family ATPase [Kofleriaceae bacterium]